MQSNAEKLPEVMVFAGPNGSGKSTITRMAKTVGIYINADDIKSTTMCSDMEAALKAEALREKMLADGSDFTFETVLSTPDRREDCFHAPAVSALRASCRP